MFLVQTDNRGHFILLLTFFVIEKWMGNKDEFEAVETVNIFVAKEIMSISRLQEAAGGSRAEN